MSPSSPRSLVAERAARYLARSGQAPSSQDLAAELLATKTPNEPAATTLLTAAFGNDRRLEYRAGCWYLSESALATVAKYDEDPTEEDPAVDAGPVGLEPDRALIFVEGGQIPGEGFRLTHVSVLRCCGEDVIAACGGDLESARPGGRLCRSIRETLYGAVPIVHDPPGSLATLDRWLEEPLDAPISLRELARDRLNLPSRHTLEDLMERLRLPWRASEDRLELAEHLDHCLLQLSRPGETLEDLRRALVREDPVDWAGFAFHREDLQAIPAAPGTYRFFDTDGKLIYVGKSRNLKQRVTSYFSSSRRRTARVRRIVERVYRFEIEASGSELEAMLREAEALRAERPEANVQRRIHASDRQDPRLRSILILEPGSGSTILRAFLICRNRLIASVGIGPRGGGLRKIERILDDCFFGDPVGPTHTEGPDLDVEVVVRWLAANRDRVVAFDPTELRASSEVIERLRWFVSEGSPFDPDGSPILPR